MEKILPLAKQVDTNTKCWPHSLLSIAALSPNYMEWLATHMEISMTDELNVFWGKGPWSYIISYFADILDIHGIDFWSITPDYIVDFLIDRINNGKYVMIDCDHNELYNNSKNEDISIHETFIYGYNTDKQIFYVRQIKLTPNDEKIPFKKIQRAFAKIYDKYRKETDVKILKYFFLINNITEFSLKSYKNENAVFEGICTIRNDHIVSRSTLEMLDENGDVRDTIVSYGGCASLLGIKEKIKNVIDNIDTYKGVYLYNFINDLCASLKTFYESRIILVKRMIWIGEKINVQDSKYCEFVEKFKTSCADFKNLYLVVFKKRRELDISFLNALSNKLQTLYSIQIKLLTEYDEIAKKCFLEYDSRLLS